MRLRTAAGSWVKTAGCWVDRAAPARGEAAVERACGWAPWAVPQMTAAIALADRTPPGASVAARLYRDWFNPSLHAAGELPAFRYALPLAGVYRAAHAGSTRRRRLDGVMVVERLDVVGRDGWWRTWGDAWMPPRQRRHGVRLVLSPRPDRLALVVRTLTTALLDVMEPWSLACATSPRRVLRTGAVVVDLASEAALPAGLVPALESALLPLLPPLCLPVGGGAALAGHPGNGMTFGEHRCQLIALALRRRTVDAPRGCDDGPLAAVAAVFGAHGIDPAAPHRYAA